MILTGLARLGRNAELRSTTGGKPVASMSLAFNYGKKGDDGKRPSQWIDASLWGDRAETLAPHLTVGKVVSVVLEDPHVEQYVKGDGTTAVKLAARVASLEFAGASPAAKPASGFDDAGDDIPF